eukprot:TRINITY_DN197_c0_g1_i2.p1 TRINITY_DN197_c0_g1~~TRINITY_DN197_c0_g1_i2.p1  ORF type:complete len:138 (-),score=14.40 TRINITY_DN197_c0_g1_i2:252-665(-)
MSTQVARPVPFPTTFSPITNKPRRSSDPTNLSVSPSKLSPEHRYAGGAFEYSPEPESLPLPSFLKRQTPSSPLSSPAMSPSSPSSSVSSPSHSADFSSSDEEDTELKPQAAYKNNKRPRYNKRTANQRRASRNSQQH